MIEHLAVEFHINLTGLCPLEPDGAPETSHSQAELNSVLQAMMMEFRFSLKF